MKNKLILLAGLLSAFSPLAASADSYIDEVIAQDVAPYLWNRDYTVIATVDTGLMEAGESVRYTITPPDGSEVILVAIGDIDSFDVDMAVVGGETGNLIASDYEMEDMAVCNFFSRGGTYDVVINLADTGLPANVRLVYAIR